MDNRYRVLVVDDEQITRILIESILDRKGYDVITLPSGKDAIKFLEEGKDIDVILLDIMMPEIDGFGVLKILKERPWTSNIKVIMLTAMSQVDDKVKAFTSGASDYLLKPFEKEELIARIDMQAKLKRTEEHLEEMVEERTKELKSKDAQLIQSAKLASLGEMAAGIAHEINQPLTVIKLTVTGMLRFIEKGREISDEKISDELRTVDQQIERISGIIDHLRTFSRRESDVQRSSVDVNDLVRNCFKLIGEQLRLREIDIVLDLEELPLTMVDSNKLEQVFFNIIGNARDAMEDLPSGNGDEKKLTVHSFRDDDSIVVTFFDTGGGIPEEIRDKIFEPFFTTKEVGKGTGIGLSICYNLMKVLNGEIGFSVSDNVGTTFYVRIPMEG
ncbi:MAG: response regulator [Halobacteriota archaeon]|nr:response regulator [Halobacteriota archaeon]